MKLNNNGEIAALSTMIKKSNPSAAEISAANNRSLNGVVGKSQGNYEVHGE